MMFQYKCLNPISPCGTSLFTEEYKQVEELQKADAVLVRSAAMHDMQDVPNLLAVARAGAGVTTSLSQIILKKESLYLTRQEPMQMV